MLGFFFLLGAKSIIDDFEEDFELPELEDTYEQPKEIDWDSLPVHDVIIIGSGPAGATAALYLARAGHTPIVFHGHVAGGQLTMTNEVENFPTFKGTGPELVRSIQQQAENAGAVFIEDTVREANFTLYPKRIMTEMGDGYITKAVIIATGANARYLGLTNEERLKNRGVSACATCDGPLFSGKDVVVVGGGDSAITEALTLNRICNSVTLLHRGEIPTASLPMRQKLEQTSVIVKGQTEVIDVLGDEYVNGVQIRDIVTGEISIISCSAMFVAIGRVPATDTFKNEIAVDSKGYFIKSGKTTESTVPGVFVAGDCADPMYRQAITSAGTGCQAALDAEKWLLKRDKMIHRPKVNTN